MRATVDYGCVVYGSAADTFLKNLDIIQEISGAAKTTPVTGDLPLELTAAGLKLLGQFKRRDTHTSHTATM